MDDCLLPCCTILIVLITIIAILGDRRFRLNNSNNNRKKALMGYYIDGTIDSIDLAMDSDEHFTLLPSAEFLKTMAEGKKKALFIGESKPVPIQGEVSGKQADEQQKLDEQQPIPALLVNVSKNEGGNEILSFKMPKTCTIFRGLLLEAKNNRNTVRVFAQSKGAKSEDSRIDFDSPVSITIL